MHINGRSVRRRWTSRVRRPKRPIGRLTKDTGWLSDILLSYADGYVDALGTRLPWAARRVINEVAYTLGELPLPLLLRLFRSDRAVDALERWFHDLCTVGRGQSR